MSLLTRISSLFSPKQSSQRIGIALQQHSLSLCSIPEQQLATNSEHASDAKAIFKSMKVESSAYSQNIELIQDDLKLAGKVHLVLNDQQSQIVQVDKPSVPEAEINGALKWQVKDLVTIAPDNMVLDYYDAPTMIAGQEKINVVCASLTELKKLVESINQADCEVESIITQEFAFANLLPVQSDASLLVCQQPNEEIVLLIVKQGQIYFHRRLRGFSQLASKSEEELSFSIIDNLSLEIQRSTDYFERQLKQASIKEIKVLLPVTQEGFIARKLSENTNVAVTLLDLPSPYHEQREYGATLGASMALNSEKLTDIAPKAQELSNVS